MFGNNKKANPDFWDIIEEITGKNPKNDSEYRRLLIEDLKSMEDGSYNAPKPEAQDERDTYDRLSVPDKIRFIQRAQNILETHKSPSEIYFYGNKLIDLHESKVDIPSILEIKEEEIENYTSVPKLN